MVKVVTNLSLRGVILFWLIWRLMMHQYIYTSVNIVTNPFLSVTLRYIAGYTQEICIISVSTAVWHLFVLLFGTVNAHGDLFVRSAKVFQAKIVWWWLPPCTNCKVLAQSQSSSKNNRVLNRVFDILNCSHWHAWEVRTELYQLGMTFVWVLISISTDVGIILMLHRSGYTRPYFWRRSLYGV